MSFALTLVGSLLCFLLTISLVLLKKRYTFWTAIEIPGPAPTLFYGNRNEGKEAHIDAHKRLARDFGKVFGVFDFMQPKLIVADADLVKKMLVQDFGHLANRRPDGFDHPLERKFSFIQQYHEWKKSRGVFSSAFTVSKVRTMFDQSLICSGKLSRYIDHLACSPEGSDIDAYGIFSKYTGDVISRSLFKVSLIDSYADSQDKMGDCLNKYVQITNWKRCLGQILPGWLKTAMYFSQFDIKALDYPISLVKHMLHERRTNSDASQEKDIVKLLSDSAEKIDWTDDHLVINLIGLYLAGQASSAMTLSYIIYAIIKYPHIQDNLIKELDKFNETGESLSFDGLNKNFDYLDAVVTEVMRLWPSSTYTERQVSSTGYTFTHGGKEFTLPLGTVVYFPVFVIQRDPDYYERPDEFDERRFLPENRENLHPYAFLPFGHGPRNCVGARLALTNIKCAILAIIKDYRFELADPRHDPMSDLSATVDEFLTPQPIRVKVKKTF